MATLVRPDWNGWVQKGRLVVHGAEARDRAGRAIVSRAFTANAFDGACAFADGAGGYALDVGMFGTARPFRIFRAGQVAP